MTYDTELSKRVKKAKKRVLQSKSSRNDLVKRADVLAAIAAEPEFPGEVPAKYWLRLKGMVEQNDREGMTELFRISVRLAKADIAERVKAL